MKYKENMYNEILFGHEKEGNSDFCYNTDASWGHYAKWSESGRERQVLSDFKYIWNPQRANLEKQRVEGELPVAVG